MSLNKALNQTQLSNWFNEKFRDGLLIKSPYDKQAHKQILSAIENNGNGGLDSSNPSITERLDKILAAVERSHECEPVDEDKLREELKSFMAEKKLSIHEVAKRIERDPKTIWQFLHRKVKPQNGTVYKIKELVGK